MKSRKICISILILVVLAVVALGTAEHPYLSQTRFCLLCHEMDHPYQEYITSKHFNNASGVRAECASCHIPEQIVPRLVRKVKSIREVYAHFTGRLDTKEKFEDQRARLAKIIWADMKANDSRQCRSCHDQQAFMFAEFTKPKEAERMQKGLKENQTCIDCHKGRIHHLPNLASGFKKLYEDLETTAADPKIRAGAVYPLTTVVCYDGKEGEREGRVLAATRLAVIEKTGSWLKVRAEGWQQDGVDAIIYELQGKRIFALALDKHARAKVTILDTMTDQDTEQVWHQVSFETWVTTRNMVENLEKLWNYGSELHGATCGCCHSLPPTRHFLANQWIGGLKDMQPYINLTKEENRFLQKYLQLHAQDVEDKNNKK